MYRDSRRFNRPIGTAARPGGSAEPPDLSGPFRLASFPVKQRLFLLAATVLALAGCGGSRQAAQEPATTTPAPSVTQATTPKPATSGLAATTTLGPPPRALAILPAGERRTAPDLSVTAFDGRTVTLGGFRGQPVVVNFFESW